MSIETDDVPTKLEDEGLYLTPEDIQGLPEELLKELSFGESEKRDFLIVDIINDLGGVAILDKILIGIYKRTGVIEKRSKLVGRLYRMGTRRLVYSHPNRKGVYATKPFTEPEVKGGVADEFEDLF